MSKYKTLKCYQCGAPFLSSFLTDTWKMRVDGVLHDIPLKNVPCHHCDKCDIAVFDGSSDETIQYCYNQYLVANNLNTLWLRFCRRVRRVVHVLESRYNMFLVRNFYANRD